MRALRPAKDNLIQINFGKQEELELNGVEETASEQPPEGMTCENGICTLNWSPKRPAKKTEAA